MRRPTLLITLVLSVLLLLPSGAGAAPDETATVGPDETVSFTRDAAGVNFCYFGLPIVGTTTCPGLNPGTCTKSPQQYCDAILVEFTNPVPDTDADGKLKRSASLALATGEYSDYDVIAYASTPDGTKGAEVGRSTASPPPLGSTSDESISLSITTTTAAPSSFVLIEVIHWAPVDAYTLTADF
jgi:hypothetical protein